MVGAVTASLMPVLGTVIVAMLGWIVTEQRALRGKIDALASEHNHLAREFSELKGEVRARFGIEDTKKIMAASEIDAAQQARS